MCTEIQLNVILKKITSNLNTMFKNKLKTIILYGSYARGDYDSESDIDIMVLVDMNKYELAKYRRDVISFLRPIEFEYNILVSIHLQDIETFNNWSDDLPYFMNVKKEGKVISA